MIKPKVSQADLMRLEEKLASMGLSTLQTTQFLGIRNKLIESSDGYIREKDLKPIDHIKTLGDDAAEKKVNCVSIKLNGGLGTSMGLTGPKSELIVKDGLSFLDICIKQAEVSASPLVLMNSPQTEPATKKYLEKLESKTKELVDTFIQSCVPKLSSDTLALPSTYIEGKMENPPGHGEVFDRLYETGLAKKLIEKGYRYALISNIDNLGAFPSNNIASYLEKNNIPFLMEVTERLQSDKKGGHLALGNDGYILRETAQCHPKDREDFENTEKYRFFNTNNIWIDLNYLEKRYENARPFELSAIANHKNLDPRDPSSEKIIQLERAMGSAIEDIEGSEILLVDRSRFSKVKNTSDLLLIRSDLYKLNEKFHIVPTNGGVMTSPPKISLCDKYFKHIDDFEKRIPKNLPSFSRLNSLTISSDSNLPEQLEGDISL